MARFTEEMGELAEERVPVACKGSIPYYTFISHEATEVLKSYLRQREERFGRIGRVGELLHHQLSDMAKAISFHDGEMLDKCPSFLCDGCKDENGHCPVDIYTYESSEL